ncbi:hypothetical protein B0H66DRAFT_215478 [Apodospora peruviana]|uniref:Uncharacterized protein n=1 Tax=Apodospora peruviana TaxID=516989 RepID=A0AAE0M8V3_9PEZI|nr:hypothetical protein B0H66DRAFT_215478 [Apodospora peruviana]
MKMDAESLIRVLRKYDASFDATVIKAAFPQSHGHDNHGDDDSEREHGQQAEAGVLADWAALHVTPDTLLSVDELNQFAALEKSGLAERLAAGSGDLGAVQAFSDPEIQDAIDELRRSTETISKQTETLKQQHEAFSRLVTSSRSDANTRSLLESKQTQRLDSQRKSIAVAVEELSQSLDSKVVEIEQQARTDAATLQQTVDSLFRSDDKLLSSLQKLGWELETEDPEEQDNVVMLRETCARLIKFTVEGLRTKLDRIYLESLESSVRSGGNTGRRVRPDEVSALQEEVESLYAEILPVAQIAAEQQFLERALKDVAAKNGHGIARSEQAVAYILDCLDYLLDNVHELSTRIGAVQAYQLAASALAGIARSELATEVELPVKRERHPTVGTSPTHRRSLVNAASSPVRPQPRPRRRSSGIGADDAPLDEILRSLALSLPQDADVQAQVKVLASSLTERRAKADDVARNVQHSFEGSAVKQIAGAKLAVQMVRDSLLAESPFGQVQLVDPEISGSIDVLSQELEDVRSRLERVDAGLAKTRGRSAKKEEFIRRWES